MYLIFKVWLYVCSPKKFICKGLTVSAFVNTLYLYKLDYQNIFMPHFMVYFMILWSKTFNITMLFIFTKDAKSLWHLNWRFVSYLSPIRRPRFALAFVDVDCCAHLSVFCTLLYSNSATYLIGTRSWTLSTNFWK